MIVSHKHRFIFLKTVKTASSSIEILLSHYCGPDDVITPTREDLAEQRAISGQNYRLDSPLVPKRPLWRGVLGRPERYYHPSVGFYEHMPAWRVRTYVGEEIWSKYYKFAFVRNPWDRQVSYYFYKTRTEKPRRSFEEFLTAKKRAYVESRDIYAIDGQVAVDFLGRYETLAQDFAKAMAAIGIPDAGALPMANVSEKPKDRYREFYTDQTRDMIGEWYAKEIEELGYTF
jgi:Sulfotransferase family